MVEIVDEKSAVAWLEEQDQQTRIWFASRCALRAIPGLFCDPQSVNRRAVFAVLRTTLLLYVAGTNHPATNHPLREASNAALESLEVWASRSHPTHPAYSDKKTAEYAARSAYYGLESVIENSASLSARALHESAEATKYPSAFSNGNSYDAYSAASDDAGSQNFKQKLWCGLEPNNFIPSFFETLWETFKETMLSEPHLWGFWLEWYEAILNGAPLDWDLSFRIATELTEDDWERGGDDWEASARHVAGRIAEIRAAWEAQRSPQSQVEPEQVDATQVISLFDRAPIIRASMGSMAASVSLSLDAFDRLERPNVPVGFIEAMRPLPQTANRISALLEAGKDAEGSQTALALEVGRLRAEVARLEAELKTAHTNLDELKKKPWYRSAWFAVPATTLTGIALGVWTLSGDDVRIEERWNNLAADFEFLLSKIKPEQGDGMEEPLRYELPDTSDV